MPEQPDNTVYVECIESKIRGDVLKRVRLFNPFLLRNSTHPRSG